MFKKILIANRGEIAVRIIRACKELGVETVAVYSEEDKESLHVQIADESICIGKGRASTSYLDMKNILSATIVSGAEAIHPGFGFLSENSKFAKMCKECSIKFIGPDYEIIDIMGNKSSAREIMINEGVPVVPGSRGSLNEFDEAVKIVDDIGFPIMIKASSGGGGRGMRISYDKKDFKDSFLAAQMESKEAFGDDSMYLERYIENPKHIEFQIIGDDFGNIVHLGERECSMQRRNQKVMEEAPSGSIDSKLREKMASAAIKAAKAVKYFSVGTVEFLLDKNNEFYFIEMNTRIQVEHPITEMVTGMDLVKEQIRVASGKKLSFSQENINLRGHAIECRINAENPYDNFRPSPGKIMDMHLPGGMGIRNDVSIYRGYKIPHIYDSMIGKLIVHGKNRNEAIEKMKSALSEYVIEGIETNIEFQLDIISQESFKNGTYDTGFLKEYLGKFL